MRRADVTGNTRKYHKTENGRAKKDEREVVLLALLSHGKNNTFSNVLVKRTLDDCGDMSQVERAFIKRLLEGVIERRTQLDAVIARFTGKPAAKLHPAILQILRMGIYQIYYMDAVPDSAACNEAVRLARRHAPARLSGFVNGVLRNVARERAAGKKDTALMQDDETRMRDLEESYSMPAWIIRMWEAELGKEQTIALLASLLEIRPVCARFCRPGSAGAARGRLIHRLRAAGALVEEGRWLSDSFRLRRTSDLRKLPGFSEGLWTVQDESSMLAVTAAGLRGEETVFDVCAAPGGKTFLAAEKLLKGGGKVYAFDLTRRKTDRIREGAERLLLSNIVVQERDARLVFPEDEGKADVLLCDLPCSGLGVIGKKRDIKYRASMEGILELQKLQREILRSAVRYLKKGGILLYSTCTISSAENEDNADWIEQTLGLQPEGLGPFLPADIPGIQGNRLQLLPHIHGTDGFFMARFRKI